MRFHRFQSRAPVSLTPVRSTSAERLATGSSVDLLSENVCVPSMARCLSGHVSEHPPQRAPLAVEGPDSERTRISHGLDGLVALTDCRNIVVHDLPGGSSGRDRHAEVPRCVVERPDEIVAEPESLRDRQMLDKPKKRGPRGHQHAAELLVAQGIGLLDDALSCEPQEGDCGVKLTRVVIRDWSTLRLGHGRHRSNGSVEPR
jgi:hypothetical protein